jgi:hypothetical protein
MHLYTYVPNVPKCIQMYPSTHVLMYRAQMYKCTITNVQVVPLVYLCDICCKYRYKMYKYKSVCTNTNLQDRCMGTRIQGIQRYTKVRKGIKGYKLVQQRYKGTQIHKGTLEVHWWHLNNLFTYFFTDISYLFTVFTYLLTILLIFATPKLLA